MLLQPKKLASDGHVPSNAMFNVDPNMNYLVDRDQQQVALETDPTVLQRAAEMAKDNHKVMNANRLHARGSHLAFGDHELNPGGHRLNKEMARHDDYGISRLRSGVPEDVGRIGAQVRELMHDPDPNAPFRPAPLPYNPHAGKSSCSDNVAFTHPGTVEPPPENEHAGKRNHSVVFSAASGPRGPEVPPGAFIGLDYAGGPLAKQNAFAQKRYLSEQMAHRLRTDPVGHHEETAAWHGRRRQSLSHNARRIPITEEVVFHAPLVGQDANATPSYPLPVESSKRSLQGARAARTNIGPRELGGEATARNPNPPSPTQRPRPYADHDGMLCYEENADRPAHARQPVPPRRPPSMVEQAMLQGTVPPNAYSEEPKGLPRRHPGKERLVRAKGVDGLGHDHQGRQLATSLVDEVVFSRSPMKGQMNLKEHGANFVINKDGDFGRR